MRKTEREKLAAQLWELATKAAQYQIGGKVLGTADIDDIISETVEMCLRDYAQYDPARCKLGTWVSAIAKNVARRMSTARQRSGILYVGDIMDWDRERQDSMDGYDNDGADDGSGEAYEDE